MSPLRTIVWGRIAPAWFIVAMGLTAGCNRQYEPPAGANDTDEQVKRVVSLAPALSQIIVQLGRGNLLVGVAQYDDATSRGLPIVGHWQDIDTEKLLSLKPTHVLTMTGKGAMPPPHLVKLAASHRFRVIAYRSPSNIRDIVKVILDEQELDASPNADQAQCLGLVLDAPDAARQVVAQMNQTFEHIRRITNNRPRIRVLLAIGVAPFMASGPGTVLDQVLSICGGDNAAGDCLIGAPVYDKEKLLQAHPDVILMLLPGAPALGSIDTDPRLALLKGLAIPAVEQDRVVLINDPHVHLPGSCMTRIAVAMAKAIHPHLAHVLDPDLDNDPAMTTSVSLRLRSKAR